MVLKDRKTGDVYKLNIINVVVECDVIYSYVSILLNSIWYICGYIYLSISYQVVKITVY